MIFFYLITARLFNMNYNVLGSFFSEKTVQLILERCDLLNTNFFLSI